MPFNFVAITKDGKKVKGNFPAESLDAATATLRSRGLEIVSIAETKSKKTINFSKIFDVFVRKIAPKELINILINIAEMDKVGVPMPQIMQIIQEDVASTSASKAFCKKVRKSVEGGDVLSVGFEKYGKVMDKMYPPFVKIAEQIGDYYTVFSKLIEYIKWSTEINANIRKTLTTTVISLVFVLGLIVTVSVVAMPKMIDFFKDMGTSIPWYTQALMDFSNFVIKDWPKLLFGLITTIVAWSGIGILAQSAAVYRDRLKTKIPIMGKLIMKIETARFVSFFILMYSCGLKIEDILKNCRSVLRNQYFANEIKKLEIAVRNGRLFQEAILEVKPVQRNIAKMLAVSFAIGNVAEIMSNIKYFLDREVNDGVQAALGAIKPISTLLIGGIVLWMAASIFGPMYKSIAKMSDGGSDSKVD
jgi:type II secretory pathway component PulF